MSGANKIYIVAGERNMLLARAGGGGLYANVGQTTREVTERLRDDDYKRKAAGGRWQILFSQEVGDSVTDKQLHPLLKSHPGVSWDPDCDNTEEFLFKDDTGDGETARRIVGEIIQQVCLPLLQAEISRLRRETSRMEEELEQRAQIIRDLASGEVVQEAMRRLDDTDDVISDLRGKLRDAISETAAVRESYEQELEWEHIENDRLQKEINARPSRERAASSVGNDGSTPWWVSLPLIGLLSGFAAYSYANGRWESALSQETLRSMGDQRVTVSWGDDPRPEEVARELALIPGLRLMAHGNVDLHERAERLAVELDMLRDPRRKPTSDVGGRDTLTRESWFEYPLTCEAIDHGPFPEGGPLGSQLRYTDCVTKVEPGKPIARALRLWGDTQLYGTVTIERRGSGVVATETVMGRTVSRPVAVR